MIIQGIGACRVTLYKVSHIIISQLTCQNRKVPIILLETRKITI